jgi:murein DD-endopeptidase MepM/ murein hydrolase activator NlpD
VFQAEDENLDTLYVEVGDAKFKAQPYLQKGYYAALIAWPFQEKEFKAKVVAVDRANNVQQVEIPFYLIAHSYDISWIEAKDKFIDGKITDLIESNPEYAESENKLEKLRAVNETMRLKNEAMIHSISKEISSEMLTGWKIHQFYPLRNGQKVASFGDERHYYYQDKGNEVSHSFHVGYDLASTKMAAIQTSNDGKVVFVGDNGIYGNMPMIDHGLGLYSLYGHCSSISVAQGDEVLAGDVIAKTGVTGLALGDHLHFGLLVQGIEVRPVEWFDQDWIRKNVDNVFEEAQKIINGK